MTVSATPVNGGYSAHGRRYAAPLQQNNVHSHGDVFTTSPQDNSRDIAIIGMACRAAGGNNSPETLWQSLLDKQDASGEMPEGRWEPYYRRDPRNPKVLKDTSSRGYYLDHLEHFDAQYFGISPMEADQMDPQQRISLEVAYEALENAGIPPKDLSGTDTAVFWGINSTDYTQLVLEDLPNIEAWMGIGTASCGAPNRISYHLNLLGPSASVDAACASSLVAVHQGVASILSGESQMAIVGGANALCGPGLFRTLDRAGALSPDGFCRSFDDAANGYARGEGAAAIILKSASQAIQDEDEILAIIKGTAVGHDGKTNGIMAPNASAQALVAQRALKVANIDPATVGYVEAHATSTPLGDPTEISALAGVYGVGRKGDPCLIGSIKPNIGHLEAGAGAMGLIKAVLALQKGVIPPQANLQNLTKRFKWEGSGLQVVQQETAWPSTDQARRAAVSSYGYGGTVSHAVIEEFIPPQPSKARVIAMKALKPSRTQPAVLLLSGRQEKRIAAQALALGEWIASSSDDHSLASIASTLALRRDQHDYRAALTIQSKEEAVEALTHLAEGKNHPWVSQSHVLDSHVNKDVVWVFSGHGAQWHNMGKELLENPVFYHAINPLDHIVKQEIGVSPISLLQSGDFDSSVHVQILTYIMQIGISAVLQSLGLFPKAIIGHSVGEIAASVVAGSLTPEEGAIIVTRRAVLYGEVRGQGAMILVNESYRNTIKKLAGKSDVVVAIDTSPSSCVVSGATKAVAQVAAEFKRQGIKTFQVKTDIAFHSPMLNRLEDPLVATLEKDIFPMPATKATLYSTCLLDPRGQDLRGPTYWANNMVSPVRLTSAVQAALDDSYRVFMEVSTHPIVCHSINETMIDADITEGIVLPTLLRDKPTEKSIFNASAYLHCQGVPIDWRRQTSDTWATDVPNTPWIHRPTGRKIETAPATAAQMHDKESHTLLGARVPVAGADTVLFTTKLDEKSKPFPLSHPVHGTEIIPAAVLLHTFFKATGTGILDNIVLRTPLATTAPRSVQIVAGRNDVKILSQLEQENPDTAASTSASWVTHTTAKWDSTNVSSSSVAQQVNIDDTKAAIKTRLADDFTIDYLAKVGVSAMGFPWQVTEHFGTTQEMLARVDSDGNSADKDKLEMDPTSWAPLFDAATSVGSTLFFDEPKLRMPAQVQRAELFTKENPPKSCWLHVQKAEESPYTSHISILDDTGLVLAKLTAMRFSEIEGAPDVANSMESLVHQISWVDIEPAKEQLSIKTVVVLSENSTLRRIYAETLPKDVEAVQVSSVQDLAAYHKDKPLAKDTIVVYIPNEALSLHDVAATTETANWDVLELLKFSVENSSLAKIFVLTRNVGEAAGPTALAHGSLLGLCRVLASEHSENFGSLIDNDEISIPLSSIQNSQGIDIVRVRNGKALAARLQGLPHQRLLPAAEATQLLPRPEGTYLITGGLGALGLQVAAFLVAKGARRLVLVSRRSLPPRKTWNSIDDEDMSNIILKIKEMEAHGASVHVLALDISVPTATQELSDSLQRLNWPPVLGVVHAAGVLDNQLALETTQDAFNRVLAPKVTGGIVLHEAFPPGSVDFFILFSSCGQLVGFTGQSSYGSGNAFLDTLATHRRAQGDRAVAFQWTSWRGLGMASSTDYINAELESKGISDVTSDDAFNAWLHLSKYDIDHGVVLRSLVFDEGEEIPSAILNDIAVRRQQSSQEQDGGNTGSSVLSNLSLPKSAADFKAYLDTKIRECVAQVLHMEAEDVDHRAALADLGIDSVMTVTVRRLLQKTLKVKMPPTLTWTHPTVGHLVGWFVEKLGSE